MPDITPSTEGVPLSNSAFLHTLGQGAPAGSTLWVTSFFGSPELTEVSNWFGKPASPQVDVWSDRNAYFSVAALKPTDDGEIKRRKANFCRLLALVVDDIPLNDVQGSVSWVIETSPGKTQVGILIDAQDEAAADIGLVDRLVTNMAERGMMGGDRAGNNAVRWVRLPVGSNLKPRQSGAWRHVVQQWNPNVVLSLEDAAAAFGVDLDRLEVERRNNPGPVSTGLVSGPQDERLRVLMGNIIRGDNLHDSANQIAASMVGSGVPGGTVVNTLRALMDASLAAKDERWVARYQDIPRCVRTAEEKYARPVVARATDEAPDDSIPVFTLSELGARMRAVRWSVKHIVPQDSLGFIFGGSGTFKSFIALDYGLHVAHGMNWLGKKTSQGPVVFIAAEGGAGIYQRAAAWHQQNKRDIAAVERAFFVITKAVSLEEEAEAVVARIGKLGVAPSVVIVDTLSQTFTGEENSAKDVAAYLKAVGTHIRAQWGCAVLIVHHSGHTATERPRGSSALRANADFMFGVFRDEKQMLATLEAHKVKDGELFPEQTFAISSHVLGKDEDGDTITSLAATGVTGEAMAEALIQEAKAGRGGRNMLLHSLAENGVEEKKLKAVFFDSLDTTDPEARRKAYYRAKEWNVRNHYLEFVDGVVIKLK